jgi:hypothetical protein
VEVAYQDEPVSASLAEVGLYTGQVAVAYALVWVVGGDGPTLLDPVEIDQRAGDVRLAHLT